MTHKIRTRMAPSPTGNLHIGTAWVTLYNWLFARRHNGEFILRIEDTDLERSKEEYEENIIEGLNWLGLNWDNKEIYRQSERLDIYEKYLKQLLDSGKAFRCAHTKEELEMEQKEQITKKEPPRHVCEHKKEPRRQGVGVPTEASGGIIRLRVDENSERKISFDDQIRGKIEFEERLMGDISLAKDLRTPLYNFAVVVDDVEMEITHVLRGEDHISNTPKQLLIYEALEKTPPMFAHLPLIHGTDHTKLSKRHGATSIDEYKKDYLPEAMLNFMGFMGYTYSKEILSKEEMAEEFKLEKVHKSPAMFDVKKLNWTNSKYLKGLPPEKFRIIVGRHNLSDSAISLMTERLDRLSEVENFSYFWQKPEYVAELLKWKSHSEKDAKMALEKVWEALKTIDFSEEVLKSVMESIVSEISTSLGLPKGDRGLVYWPVRVALSGRENSPDPIQIALVLGPDETLNRISKAIDKIG